VTRPATASATPQRGAVRAALAAWGIVSILTVIRQWSAIVNLRFADPDDALRLVQVRELLAGQGWFDLHNYRINPPDGVIMHWSRLVDAPLAAVIAVLRPLIGQGAAEQVAVVAVPLFTLLLAQLCIARIVVRQFGATTAALAALMLMLMLPSMMQFEPPRIDHHAWQVVAVLAAIGGICADRAWRAGWLAGGALAFGLSVSLELLPFAALFAGLFGLRWVSGPKQPGWLLHYLAALTLCSIGFFLGTRGVADLTNYCDAVSPAYLAALALITVLCLGLALLPLRKGAVLLALLGTAGLAGAAGFLWLAPECSSGPFARLDPLVRTLWYENVAEGRPIYHLDWALQAQMLVPPLLGLVAALRLAWTRHSRFWSEFALLLAGAIAISLAVSRFSAVSTAMAVIPLSWQLRRWAEAVAAAKPLAWQVVLGAAIIAAVLPGIALQGIERGWTRVTAKVALADGAARAALPADLDSPVNKACSMPGSFRLLATLPRATLFTQLDVGPDLLVQTPHRVVATGHHRAARQMHDVIAAFMADPQAAEAIVRRHRAGYVMVCTDLSETLIYAHKAPHGLAASLLAGRPVGWLQPVALPAEAGALRLWRVVPR